MPLFIWIKLVLTKRSRLRKQGTAIHVIQVIFKPHVWIFTLLKVKVPNQVPVNPRPIWSRMKALCQDCLLSKHSAGSCSHTPFPYLLMPLLGSHRHRCVCFCFMYTWPTDRHLSELSVSQTGHGSSSWAAKSNTWITPLPLQPYGMFYSPLSLSLALVLSFSALPSPRGSSGTFPSVH